MRGYNIEGGINNTLKSFSNIPGGLQQQVQQLGLNTQVEQRPWLMIGAALATGYILGSLLGGDDDSSSREHSSYDQARHDNRPAPAANAYNMYPNNNSSQLNSTYNNAPAGPSASATPSYYSLSSTDDTTTQPSVSSSIPPVSAPLTSSSTQPASSQNSLLSSFSGEFESYKSQATSTIKSLIRDTLRDNLPQLREQVDQLDQRSPIKDS